MTSARLIRSNAISCAPDFALRRSRARFVPASLRICVVAFVKTATLCRAKWRDSCASRSEEAHSDIGSGRTSAARSWLLRSARALFADRTSLCSKLEWRRFVAAVVISARERSESQNHISRLFASRADFAVA